MDSGRKSRVIGDGITGYRQLHPNPVPTVDSNVQRYVLDSGSRAIALMNLNFETKLYIGRIKWFLWFENFK